MEAVGQSRVVEAQEVQDRGVQVVNVHALFDGVEAEVVALAEPDARTNDNGVSSNI